MLGAGHYQKSLRAALGKGGAAKAVVPKAGKHIPNISDDQRAVPKATGPDGHGHLGGDDNADLPVGRPKRAPRLAARLRKPKAKAKPKSPAAVRKPAPAVGRDEDDAPDHAQVHALPRRGRLAVALRGMRKNATPNMEYGEHMIA